MPPKEKERIINEAWTEVMEIEAEKRRHQAEIIARREERKAETKKRHQEHIDILKEHIKSGKTMAKAARLMGCCVEYAYRIRKESIQDGTWLTKEELAKVEEQKRREQEKARRKRERERKKEAERKREENQFRIKKEAFRVLMYRKQEMPYKEIAEKMNYSVTHLVTLKRLADKLFHDEDALREFEAILKLREEKEQEQEQIRQKRELKQAKREMREQEALNKAFKKDRKQKIKGYATSYKKYKKLAKKEDDLELDGEENISTEGRKKFLGVLTALHDLEANIPDRDIEFMINTFEMHPEIADKDSIKFLISYASKQDGLKSTIRMTNELAGTLKYTKFQKPLIEYGRWLKKLALRPQMQEMKKQKMSNTEIGEKLGISSAEVSIILHNDKKPGFPDFENR